MRALTGQCRSSFAGADVDACVWALIEGDLQSYDALATEAFESGPPPARPTEGFSLARSVHHPATTQGLNGQHDDQLAQRSERARQAFLLWDGCGDSRDPGRARAARR